MSRRTTWSQRPSRDAQRLRDMTGLRRAQKRRDKMELRGDQLTAYQRLQAMCPAHRALAHKALMQAEAERPCYGMTHDRAAR